MKDGSTWKLVSYKLKVSTLTMPAKVKDRYGKEKGKQAATPKAILPSLSSDDDHDDYDDYDEHDDHDEHD